MSPYSLLRQFANAYREINIVIVTGNNKNCSGSTRLILIAIMITMGLNRPESESHCNTLRLSGSMFFALVLNTKVKKALIKAKYSGKFSNMGEWGLKKGGQ